MDNADVQNVTVNLGFFNPPSFVGFLTRQDSVLENEECLVVELSVNEDDLEDDRDRGQVDFDRNVALFRIRDLGTYIYNMGIMFDVCYHTLLIGVSIMYSARAFTCLLIYSHTVPLLTCQPILDTRLNTLNCFGQPNPVHNATCSYDDGPPQSCELNYLWLWTS